MTARIACFLLVALAAATVDAPAAGEKPAPKPGVLWQEYPLGDKRLTGTTATRPAPTLPATKRGGGQTSVLTPPDRSQPRSTDGSSGSAGLPIGSVALGAAGAVLALAFVTFLYVRSRRRRVDVYAEAAVAGPLATITLAATRLESRRRARGVEHRLPAWDKSTTKTRRRAAVTDQLDERVEAGVAGEAKDSRQSHTDVGDRVAGVIRAAEELAEQIRSDVHQEAAQIKREAEDARGAAMRELASEQDELRAAAEAHAAEIRRTGETYATEHRREAEAEATKLVGEAETQARAMREAAEQMAMRIETTALQRREELEERTRVVETRLRRFQKGLRQMSTDLDELLEPGRAQDETILEVLDVDQRQPSAQHAHGGQRPD
jgi:hypothetical protein